MTTSSSSTQQQPPPPPIIEDLEWEEWDSTGGLSFTHHCLAGSFAGVAEHTLLYPLDTVKTCWQSQVLHRAVAGGSVAGGCDPCSVHQTVYKFTPPSSSSSSSASIVNSTTTLSPAATVHSTGNSASNMTAPLQQQQSIWSTMKHLMRHGSHHHHQGGGHSGLLTPPPQFSHARVYTFANNSTAIATTAAAVLENHVLAPNVVDLTTATTTAITATKNSSNKNVENINKSTFSSSSSTNHPSQQQQQRTSISNGGSSSKRPWSKSARIIRGATLQDIAPALQPSLYHSSSNNSSVAMATTTVGTGGGGSGGGSSSISSSTNSFFGSNNNTTNNMLLQNNKNGTTVHNNTGFKRLWRGVQTMFVGCIPAHALYFSSYEIIKSICLDHNTTTASSSSHHGGNNNNTTTTNDTHGGGGKSYETNETSSSSSHHVGIDTLSPSQAMFAGGIATLLHDFIMTPMDTMKQRMQLGHYNNLRDAFCSIVWGDRRRVVVGGVGDVNNTTTGMKEKVQRMGGEGWKGLYRSFPITVMTNVPYGMIMMTTNEWLRAALEDGLYGFHEHYPGGNNHHHDEKPFHFFTILLSGMGAGTVASAITAPLDRVKTRLQTQRMGMILPSSVMEGGVAGVGGGRGGGGAVIMEERALAAAMGERKVCPKMVVQDVKSALFPSSSSSSSSLTVSSRSIPRSPPSLVQSPFTKTYYTTPIEAFQSILQEEGPRGLFRGALPRVALHAPSVAISWTAYEMAKGWLMWLQ